MTIEEDSAMQQDEFERLKHKFLHQSWIMFDMQYGTSLDFIDNEDPLAFIRAIKDCCTDKTMPRSTSVDNPLHMTGTNLQYCHVWKQRLLGKVASLSNMLAINDESLGAYHVNAAELPIVIDTGASTSLSPVLSDFIGPLEPAPLEINGLANTTQVDGQGWVEWTIIDLRGLKRIIKTRALYVPDASIHLFSPQAFFQENEDKGKCTVTSTRTWLTMPDTTLLEFPYNPGNNLPMMITTHINLAGLDRTDILNMIEQDAFMSVADPANQNLTAA